VLQPTELPKPPKKTKTNVKNILIKMAAQTGEVIQHRMQIERLCGALKPGNFGWAVTPLPPPGGLKTPSNNSIWG